MSLEEDLEKRVDKYQKLTEKALGVIKLNKGLTPEQKLIAEDFLSMARNYLNDGKYYRENKILTYRFYISLHHASITLKSFLTLEIYFQGSVIPGCSVTLPSLVLTQTVLVLLRKLFVD